MLIYSYAQDKMGNMEKIRKTILFWTRVVGLSFKASLSINETGEKFTEIILNYFLLFILSSVSIIGLKQTGLVENIGLNIETLLYLVILGVALRFLTNLFYIPVKKDVEQKQIIEKLEQEVLLDNLKFDLFCPRPLPSPEGDSLVETRIKNTSSIHTVERCKVTLREVKKLPDRTPHLFDYRAKLPAILEWSDNHLPDSNGCITIEPFESGR